MRCLGVVFFLLICAGLCLINPILGLILLLLAIVVKVLMG